ncbi:putative Transmembrane amino acid transporter protein [Trypanosoma vivax]|uniref:Amino acid transporter n=1 Tax=Trypanosoma vivax (strain Y486) TaxID=1055687 RepID=G0TZY6_TRYVY|nr:putative Transmembrane amino acid transporter protein [Trypanosoma vivax]CCC50166.1 amino acid transporter [Trypanosoma vivax Y486]
MQASGQSKETGDCRGSARSAAPYADGPVPSGANGDRKGKDNGTTGTPEEQPAAKKGFLTRVGLLMTTLIPPGGVIASAFNLASTSIGAGIFGLPSATNNSGLIVGLLYLALITFLTIYSVHCLVLVGERIGVFTYEGVTRALLGPAAAHTLAVIRAFFGFSCCVAYVICVHDIIAATMLNVDAPKFLKQKSGVRLLTFLMWLFFMLPLVIPKQIDTLRHVSAFAVVFMVYVVGVVIAHSCTHGLPENVKSIRLTNEEDASVVLFNNGNRAIQGLGVIMFAYVCQITAYEIYYDMTNRSVYKFTVATSLGMLMACAMYVLTSVFGYLDFGSKVTGSVLLLYDPIAVPAMMVAYVGVLVLMFVSFAILLIPSRNALYSIVDWDPEALPFWKRCCSVVFLAGLALVCGLFIPGVNTVFGFAGSLSGGLLGFIFPALIMMYGGGFAWDKVGPYHYITTYGLLICGVVVVVFGTGATIWSAAVQ